MCDQLSDLRRATASFAARFDAKLLSCADARRVVKDAASIEAMAQTLKSLAAARGSESDSWRRNGHRSAPEELARETGTSVSSAKEVIETGRRLGSRPKLDRAARRGELSFAQTSMIADASEADPGAEGPLLKDASRLSISELKDRCAKTKADAHPDLEARRKEIHTRRYLRSWTDVEGMWHLSAGANPEDGAKVMAALSPITQEIFATARKEGRREHPSAYALDSLVRLSEEACGAGARPGDCEPGRRTPVKLLVRIDYDT
ncbi:MAG: DUF222 domain-containing protein, partial [Acidimicrobiales bacterium]